MYDCPVCGFNKLLYPIDEDPICPSCYTEFGYDDVGKTIYDLRKDWIDRGMPWGALNVERAPDNWDPIMQLRNVGNVASNPKPTTVVSRIIFEPWTMPILDFQGSFTNCNA